MPATLHGTRTYRPSPGLIVACAAALLASCDNPGTTEVSTLPLDLSRSLTGEAARSLTGNGEFVLAKATAPGDVPIISADRARELAEAFVRSWGDDAAPSWKYQRGGEIAPSALETDPRVFYAETPHTTLPTNGLHPAYQRLYGPVYVVHFNSGGEHVLMVAVSAYATDLEIDADGRVVSPPLGGNYFFPVAVSIDPSAGPTRYVPVSPEEAVAQVVEATGGKVAKAPRLILLDRRYHPALAQWRIELETPVRVRKTVGGERSTARELYVGQGRRLAVAAANQPASRSVKYVPDQGESRESVAHGEFDLPRRPDIPVEFVQVTPDAES